MDELWQRYRTFWTPVLIGLGAFLVGVIVVHIMSDDPDDTRGRVLASERRLKRMQMPDPKKATMLKARTETFQGENRTWTERLNQTGGEQTALIASAAEQALRASLLRGAPAEEARDPGRLAPRFDDDEVAAANANRRFERLLQQHKEQLASGDPNVAFSRLLSDVWTELRVRANRADVEIGAEYLGFGSISSVSRATLAGRVLNLALVARTLDVGIRHGLHALNDVQVSAQIDPGNPEDFLVLLPVDMVMVGDMEAMRHVLALFTDPEHPVPLELTRLAQPKRGAGSDAGLIELSVRASSAIVRPDADLKLDVEEDK